MKTMCIITLVISVMSVFMFIFFTLRVAMVGFFATSSLLDYIHVSSLILLLQKRPLFIRRLQKYKIYWKYFIFALH